MYCFIHIIYMYYLIYTQFYKLFYIFILSFFKVFYLYVTSNFPHLIVNARALFASKIHKK